MKLLYKLSYISLISVLLTGCSDKQFSLQNYADEHLNNKTAKDDLNLSSHNDPIDTQTANHSLKTGPASDIAWSRNYKKEKGILQKSLDNWMEEEWNPSFEGNATQAARDENASHNFTLQHYYDKSQIYLEKQEEKKAGIEDEPAHYEKMNQLPVIGK